MKTKILGVLLLVTGFCAQAQNGSAFGIKGGINYNGNGDFFDAAESIVESPEKNMGFHIGIFGKLGNKLFLRPELMYTHTRSKYTKGDLKLNKLDLPVLVGLEILGPLHVFAGPSFQYILKSKFDGVTFNDIEKDFTVGAHIGAGLNLGKFGIDVRYERGFTENEINFINSNILSLNGDRIDTRPEQIIVSLSLKL